MYSVIKGSAVNYNKKSPFVIESALEDKSDELSEEQDAIVTSEINRRIKEIEKNADVIADEIIQKAQAEADDILTQVQEESIEIFNSKRNEGFEAGANEAAEKFSVILDKSERLIESEKSRFENEISNLKDDILDLALDMAYKITNIEFSRNETAIQSVLSKVIEEYKNEKKIIIEVSADNLAKLKETELAQKYIMQENKSLGKKDALINLEQGVIDVSIDRQFENLKTTMSDA